MEKKEFSYNNPNQNPTYSNILKDPPPNSIDNEFLGQYKNDYKIIQIMKKDLIFIIYKAINLFDGRCVCLKVYNKNKLKIGDFDYFIEQIQKEEEIVKLCKCQNIVNIYKKIENQSFIIFEMDSWDFNLDDYYIKKKIGFFDEKSFEKILSEITNALKVLNGNGVMHRDIRPSNLFAVKEINNSYHYKLGGFEHSIYIKDNTSEPVGSYFYAAPEIIKNLQYDEKCDLWSLGITLHELLFQQLPYGKNVTINIIKQAIYYEDDFYFQKSNYSGINTLFKKLLTINRKNRINFNEFLSYNLYLKEDIITEKFFQKSDQECNNLIYNPIFPVRIRSDQTCYHPTVTEKDPIFQLFGGEKNNEYLNNKFMNKILEIIEGDHLPDIMDFPYSNIESKKEMKFNNIIYYNENNQFIQSINKDCDIFEKTTAGVFIFCNNLESLTIIREEILKQIKKDKRIIFNLITTGSSSEKIIEFLREKKEFYECIKNICIYCFDLKKYQYLKFKYPKINDDI